MAGISGEPIYTLPDGRKTTDRAAYLKAKETAQVAQPYTAAEPSRAAASVAQSGAQNKANSTGVGYSVDPFGHTNYDNTAALQAKFQKEQDERRLAAMKGLSGSLSSGGADPGPRVQHDANGQEAAARAAAFGRAKDQIGQSTRGAVDSLRDAYGGSGSSGAQREGMEGIMGQGLGHVNEFTREQLMQDLARSGEVSDLTYGGNITQRQQDIQAQQQKQSVLMGLYSQIY